jgi:PBSX family phage terminase large subunit
MATKTLTRKQRKSYKLSTMRVNIWEGAVRSGKTIVSILRWIQYIKQAPEGNLLMTGKTERTLKRNIIDVMVQMLGPKRCVYIAGKGELHVLGRIVYVAGANDEAAQEKIRGLTLAGAYGDEISIWPESYFTMLMSRLSIYGSQFFGTTNPDNPSHWLKKLLDRVAVHLHGDGSVTRQALGTRTRKGKVVNWSRMTFILRDNPHLPKDYVDSLEAEYTGLWYRRFILGHWVAAEGAVYDMWDEDIHVVHELPEMKRVLAQGIDYGTSNATAGIILGLGVDNVLYAYHEWAPTKGSTDGELTAALRKHMEGLRAPDYIFVDPAAASLKRQLHVDGFRGLKNANHDVDNGIRLVASLLKAGRLRIHVSCAELRDELPGYSWDPKATIKGEDKVIKQNDHFCDALRYAVYSSRTLWKFILTLPPPQHINERVKEAA